MHSVSEVEAGEEMGPTDDVVGIKETKCAIIKGRDELYPVQSLSLPTGPMGFINLEPADPEDVHPGLS